jgi:hypothetical protein
VVVQNDSGSVWPGFNVRPFYGDRTVALSYHWLDTGGRVIVHGGLRTPLPYRMRPGQSEQIEFEFDSPPDPGQYLLELDLVYENVSWFSWEGSPTLRRQIAVVR